MNTIILLLLVSALIIVGCMRLLSTDTYEGPRDKIYYGYYGDMASQLEETKDHVNTVWIAAWDSHPLTWTGSVFQRVAAASAEGKKSVIMMTNNTYVNGKLNYQALQELDELLLNLSGTDYIKDIVAIYPTDEPDGSNITSEEIAKTNNAIRDILRKYPPLKNVALAVFYTGSEKYPGIQYYDWVGFDEYHKGESVLGAKYNRMVSKLRDDQRTMIIPGGCDKWRQDPRPFVDFALNNHRVVAVVPFIWIDNAAPGNRDVGLGIRSNGLKYLYREAGAALINAAKQ